MGNRKQQGPAGKCPGNGRSNGVDALAIMLRAAEERARERPENPTPGAGGGGREDRRDSVIDRRTGLDRRGIEEFARQRRASDESEGGDGSGAASSSAADGAATASNLSTNLERRRGPGRRRTDFMKCADEGEMTQEQFLFIMAIEAFKRVNGKTFPTWTDVLEVIRKLGYRKTMPSELNLGANVEDWDEAANAPAGVFKEAEDD